MKQRKTQTPEFWQEQFQINPNDVEVISNQIIDESRIFSLDEIAFSIAQQTCEDEERRMIELQDGRLYQPKEHYEVDEKVFFPQLDFAVGTVNQVRGGNHPNYDQFSVIGVTFKTGGRTREFVADFDYDHNLNSHHEGLADIQGFLTPEEVYQTYQTTIQNKVKATFDNHEDFIGFQDRYFLKDLLPEFQEGLFNIADAAIDIHSKPLTIDTLVAEIGLLDDGQATDINRFMINCQLAADARFTDVGPTGQVLWYLTRLQPDNLGVTPPWLASDSAEDYDVSILDEELQEILADIDDELVHPDDMPTVDEDVKEVTIGLVYPHWRAGSLPVTTKTRSFFPQSSYNPVLVEFIDGRSGDSFSGWVVQQENYVLGLEEWYKKYSLPVGTFITLKKSTDDPTKIVIDYQPVRSQRDWVRQTTISNNKLRFKMNTGAIGCKYDELMMIGLDNSSKVDALWNKAQERNLSVYDALCDMILELSKLSPQSTVHIKTLYTAVNILRRASPGLIFQELVNNPEFVGMKHGYWSYGSSDKK
ncbi:hypothetical protein QUF58_02715 [Anaerolineales bacterium HSG24]|nr:hypothetical protein [Anaerolineales bacterium HSG24]